MKGSIFSAENLKHPIDGHLRQMGVYGRKIKGDGPKRRVIKIDSQNVKFFYTEIISEYVDLRYERFDLSRSDNLILSEGVNHQCFYLK